jgi:hypothetical protein
MSNPKRRSIASTDRGQLAHVRKGGVVTSEAGGALAPAGLSTSGIMGLTKPEEPDTDEQPVAKDAESEAEEQAGEESVENTTKFFIPILKAEQRLITGVVLQPEVVDAQGDIMSSDVIKDAAHRFLAQYNKSTKMGLMHKDFKPRFDLVESYLAPVDITLNGSIVKAGSWIMVVKVLDDSIWEQVKKGKLTGFSIGGKARVQKITPKAAA